MAVTIRQVGPCLAGEVDGIDMAKPMTAAEVAAIHAGMDKYAVLVFRNQQHISDEQQLAFSRSLGELRLVRAITEEQMAAMRNPALVPNTKLPRIEDAVKAGGFLAGTPADIIEQLKAVEKRYPGLDRVICTMPLGTPLSVTLEQIERFANEVMPAFKPMKAAAE